VGQRVRYHFNPGNRFATSSASWRHASQRASHGGILAASSGLAARMPRSLAIKDDCHYHFNPGNRFVTSSALARRLKALMRKQPSPSN
jgi:hypothetical protein